MDGLLGFLGTLVSLSAGERERIAATLADGSRLVVPDAPDADYDLGGARYLRDGEILSDATLAQLRRHDAILLGAVGTPEVPPGVIERGLLLKMRFELDLYINQRPFVGPDHEFVVIRENTEGPYAGEGGVLRKGTAHEVATQGSVNTRMGVERCVRYAFELARSILLNTTHPNITDALPFHIYLAETVLNNSMITSTFLSNKEKKKSIVTVLEQVLIVSLAYTLL